MPLRSNHKASSELITEVGEQVIHALNNSGHIPPRFPYYETVLQVLTALELHNISPYLPTGSKEYELPLIIHYTEHFLNNPPATPNDTLTNLPHYHRNPIQLVTSFPLPIKLLFIALPFILIILTLYYTHHRPLYITFPLLIAAWYIGRHIPTRLIIRYCKTPNPTPKEHTMKHLTLLLLTPALLTLTGCSIPSYERTVVKTYDGQGTLQSAVVTEHVRQIDPYSRPLLKPLQNQTYQKQP